jgi:hypothetical protein
MVNARIYKEDTLYCEATGVFVRVPIELLKQQPDMARMVEIVESIKSGRSIHELIELDRARRRVRRAANAPNDDAWGELAERWQRLARDILAQAAGAFSNLLK